MEAYKTIQGTAQARIEEKKSEFIAHAAFADTEEKALAFLNGIRAKHRTANHNVYAYILRDGAVILVDEFTGRAAPGRVFPGDLQAAVEAKHGLKLTTVITACSC